MPHTKCSGSDAIWIVTRLAIYARDWWQCFVCGVDVEHARQSNGAMRATLDHIQPGKNNKPTNLITMCMGCNNNKRSRHIKDWRPGLYAAAKRQARRSLDRKRARAVAIELGYDNRLNRRRR